eukprot:1492123-Amphidinium_carterae.1
MSCDAGELAILMKQLAALEKKLAAQAGRKPNKGACKRDNKEGGKGAQTKSGDQPLVDGPGRPVLPTLADAMKALFKEQLKLA